MAKEAERLLVDTGWLPEPLRIAAADDAPVEATEDDGEALPEFLAADDEETDVDAPRVIAAE
jgi:ParB family chromosome partitioning protein